MTVSRNITISCHYAGFLCYSELLVVSVATFVAFSFTRPINDYPEFSLVEWDDEKTKSKLTHSVYSVRGTRLVTLADSSCCLQSPSHNIRNYKSSIHVFCVVDRRDLHQSLSGLAQKKWRREGKAEQQKPQRQGRELLKKPADHFSRFFLRKKNASIYTEQNWHSWMTRKSAFIALILACSR